MPKHIKIVEDVLRKARQNGTSKKGPYSAEFSKQAEIINLYHYGTLIFSFSLNQGRVIQLGGWSGSDRDAINTAMTVVGLRTYVSNAKSNANKGYPQMNGWYIIGGR